MNDRYSGDDLPRKPGSAPPRSPWPIDLAHIRPFRIGDVEVRPASREVVGGSQREVLEPLVMQVLVALASARGEILSRDDLIEACWGGRAVTDDALNRVLSRLRALARTFESFQVETIVKVGYRLVEIGGDQRSASPESWLARPKEPAGVGRRPLLIGGAAVAVSALGAGAWMAWNRYAATTRQSSIAVLPFANLSGDPARQYFADGMAEELRSALARIGRLKVIGRTSSESVRDMEARAAARKLGVGHILLGSIRQSSTTIRVSAQLVDGSSGVELWSETYDRPPGDILAIQSGIAQRVAEALVVRLAADERTALVAGGTTSAAAYDLMLKTRALDASFDSEEAQRKAVGFMDAAIALDPQYADAHATRSLRLLQIASFFVDSVAEAHAMAEDAARGARRAVALAPNIAAGHSALGWALHFQLLFIEAQRALERAYRLGRGDARTLRIYGTFLWRIGKVGEAQKLADESAALDPLHPRHLYMVAQIHMAARRYGEAVAAARRSLQLAPTRIGVRSTLANCLILMGRFREARTELEKLPQGSLPRLTAEAILFQRIGDKIRSDRAVAEIRARPGGLGTYELARIHAQRGEADQALAMLDAALRNRDPDLGVLAGDRLFDPLIGDARFQSIIQRLKLPN